MSEDEARMVHVRRAQGGDVATLVALMDEFYGESACELDRERAGEAFATLLADGRLGQAWLGEVDRTPAGYLVASFVYAMQYGGTTAIVDDLFVRPAFRGRGLGTALVAVAREACTDLGATALSVEVSPENETAQAVYRRAGFTTADRRLMTLPLAAPIHSTAVARDH